MKTKKRPICIGIDPGIGNTGLAVVERTRDGYQLIYSNYTETFKKSTLGDRLDTHFIAIHDKLMGYKPDLLAIEAIYFNRNISSCISTASVIAVAELAAFRLGVETLQVNPQVVKQAVGCRGNDPKAKVGKLVNKVLRLPADKMIKNEHEADAAAVAIAGLLEI